MVSNSAPLAEGTVIMADHQFAGRGQQENAWHSEAGKNLTFSIYLCPSFLPIGKQFLLNMAVSIGIRDALSNYLGDQLKVKWPNDLYYGCQKLGGILIENMLSGLTFKASIIGIGINVNQMNFNAALQNRATSIQKILQLDVNLIELLGAICSHIEVQYMKLKIGNLDNLQQNYLSGLYRFGKNGLYSHFGQTFAGKITGVTETGQLVISSGSMEKQYNFKEVEFLENI